jgi:hypothetical protein
MRRERRRVRGPRPRRSDRPTGLLRTWRSGLVAALVGLLVVGTVPVAAAAPSANLRADVRIVGVAVPTAIHDGLPTEVSFSVLARCPRGERWTMPLAGVPGLRLDGALAEPHLPGHTAPVVVDCTGRWQRLTGAAIANHRNQAPPSCGCPAGDSDEWASFGSRVTLTVDLEGSMTATTTRTVRVLPTGPSPHRFAARAR